MKLRNLETGKEMEIVYFKNNNGEVLAEYVSEKLKTGKYELIND